MNEDSARKVIDILLMADGGNCAHCAYYQVMRFIEAFPEFSGIAITMYEDKFEMKYGDVER